MKKLIVYPMIISAFLLTGCTTPNNASYTNNATQKQEGMTQDQAKEMALAHANVMEKDVKQLKITKQTDRYHIEFLTSDKLYKYDIQQNNGEIIDSFYTTNTAQEDNTTGSSNSNTTSTQSNQDGQITAQKAKEIALAHANVKEADTQLLKTKEDYEDGIAVYEVTFYVGNKEYDYDIVKTTGKILKYDYDIEDVPTNGTTNQTSQISLEKAKQLALAKVPGATTQNIHIKQDYDDGRLIYEGEIYYNHVEYEFEIDGSTGNFLEWSVD